MAVLGDKNISNEQLEGMGKLYGLPVNDRSKLIAALASRLSDKQIVEYLSNHPRVRRTA